jgi:autotransporter-associated beta strand protein
MRKSNRAALILASAVGLVQVAHGANASWNGAPGTSFWNAANWDNSGPYTPVSGDALFFGANGNTATFNDFIGASFSGLTFNTGAQAFTLDGNDLALTGPIVSDAANGNTQTIDFNITGATALNLGTDQSGGNNLTFNGNVTAGGLNVTSQSTTANTLAIGAGKILTINGNMNVGSVAAAGTLRANLTVTGNELDVNGTVSISRASSSGSNRNIGTLNLSGLSTFKVNAGSTGTFGVGVESQAVGTATLANTLNQITAGTIAVGWSANNNSGSSDLFLGATDNFLNTGTLVMGRGKGVGTIAFAGSTGQVTIAGVTGGSSTANITIGSADSATAATGVSGMILAGHQATVQGGTVIVGQQTNNSNSATSAPVVTGTGILTFDTGNFTAANLQLANNTGGTSTDGATGTLILGTNASSTGSLNVTNSFSMGNLTNTLNSGFLTRTISAFTINGGTANINADITLTNTSAVNTATATLTLAGGTLNMMGHKIGVPSTAITTFNMIMPVGGQSATIANLGGTGINGAGLNMNGGGTLFLAGSNTYSGNTIISSGTLTPLASATFVKPVFEVRNGGNLDVTQMSSPQIPVGATISGNGTVQGTATVGGIIAPGNNSVAGSTTGTLNFANNLNLAGGGTLAFELSNSTGGSNDAVNVAGNLDLSGTTRIKLTALNGGFDTNTYTLMSYASLTGTGTILAPGQGLITRQTFNLNVGANQTTLTVSGTPAATLTWAGDGSINNWDHSANDWNNGGNSDKFFDLDSVTFDDNGSTSPSINVVGAVVPASVTVSANSNQYTFAGSGSITTDTFNKTGGTTLTIANSGVNSLGSVSINSGTLVFLANNTSAGTTTIANGAALQIGGGTTSGGTGILSNTVNNGTVIFNRSDTVVVTDNMTGTGAIQNLAGTLSIGNGGTLGSVSSGTITNNGTLVFNKTTSFAANNLIEGTGALRKQGSGNVTLPGSNTYTGNTVIEAGKIMAGVSGTVTLGSQTVTPLGAVNGGTVDVLNGAAIDVGGGAAGNSVSFGTKGIYIIGNGPDTNGALTNSSTTGQQNAFSNVILKGNASVGGTGRFDIRGVAVGGVNAATLDLAGNTLTKNGNAQFTLVGTTVTPGNIVVNGGTLSSETTTTMSAGGGSVNIAGDNVTASFFNVTDPTLNVRPYFFNGNNDTLTNLSGGTPSIIGMPIILNKSVNVSLNTGTTTAQGGLTIQGPISGAGALIKTGNGSNSLILSGTNTYTGGTTLNAGPLITNTNFSNGTITITGGAMKVNPQPSSDSAAGLTVVPAITVATGSLDLTNNAMVVDYAPGNSPLTSIRAAIISGYANNAWNGPGITSSSAAASPVGTGRTALGYAEASAVGITSVAGHPVDNSSVIVEYTLAGDANLDRTVNALDFNAVASNFGLSSGALWRQGDFNYDGIVDTNDFTAMSQNFGQPLTDGALAPSLGSVVPEPASVAMLVLGAGLLSTRRRRK